MSAEQATPEARTVDITNRLQQLSTGIAEARRRLDTNEPIALEHLLEEFEQLSVSLQDIPPHGRTELERSLLALLDEVNELTGALEVARDAAQHAAQGATERRRASLAYSTGFARPRGWSS